MGQSYSIVTTGIGLTNCHNWNKIDPIVTTNKIDPLSQLEQDWTIVTPGIRLTHCHDWNKINALSQLNKIDPLSRLE